MVFPYYAKLSRAQKAVYRKSDAIEKVPVPDVTALWPLIIELQTALQAEDRKSVQAIIGRLLVGLSRAVGVSAVNVKVLPARPSRNWGELHGLYEREEGTTAQISVWMRTAKNKKVVAFKTFLRTVLHELCHHLDYELYKLDDSLHTEGFFKRESSLFHQLVTDQNREQEQI